MEEATEEEEEEEIQAERVHHYSREFSSSTFVFIVLEFEKE